MEREFIYTDASLDDSGEVSGVAVKYGKTIKAAA